MTASTNPQEILDVDNWLSQNPGLTGTGLTDAAQQQGFDPAFIALVNFPQVLEMMAQHIDDYAAIRQAFSANQAWSPIPFSDCAHRHRWSDDS